MAASAFHTRTLRPSVSKQMRPPRWCALLCSSCQVGLKRSIKHMQLQLCWFFAHSPSFLPSIPPRRCGTLCARCIARSRATPLAPPHPLRTRPRPRFSLGRPGAGLVCCGLEWKCMRISLSVCFVMRSSFFFTLLLTALFCDWQLRG